MRAIKAVIPPNQPARSNELATWHSTPSAISSSGSIPSSIIKVSRHATTRPRATSLPDCSWSADSLGSNDGQALTKPQIFRRFLTAILDDIEGYLRTLGQRSETRSFHRRDMDEYVFASTAVWLNEAVTLGRIEPLHCSARHVALPDKDNGKFRSAKPQASKRKPPEFIRGRL